MKNKVIFPAFACGVISAALDFWLIPSYLARGIPDYIWMTLMILLPTITAVLLLCKYPPKSLLWSTLIQCVIVIVLANPIGNILGYQLGNIANDLFDYLGYLIFVFGWISAVTAVQYIALKLIQILRRGR